MVFDLLYDIWPGVPTLPFSTVINEFFAFLLYTMTSFAVLALISSTHSGAKYVKKHLSKKKDEGATTTKMFLMRGSMRSVKAKPTIDDRAASKLFTSIDASDEVVHFAPPTPSAATERISNPVSDTASETTSDASSSCCDDAPPAVVDTTTTGNSKLLPNLSAKPLVCSSQLLNAVPGEIRHRADMSLYRAKIRVGKAFLYKPPSGDSQYGVYIIRVDCGGHNEKHMNPVVMWDVSCRFSSFVKLAIQMKKELRDNTSNGKVPALPSKTFTRQVTPTLLEERKQHLQTFLDTIVADEELANLHSFREFCEAV